MSAPSLVVGAGPAGIYAADILTQLAPGTQVDLFEKLPTIGGGRLRHSALADGRQR